MSEVSATRSASPTMQAGGLRVQEEARADRNQAQEDRAEGAGARRQEKRQRAARAEQASQSEQAEQVRQQQAVQQERQVNESQDQRLEMEARQGRGQIVDTLA